MRTFVKLLFSTSLLCLGCIASVHADSVMIDGINYQLDEESREATIIQSSSFAESELVIPGAIHVGGVTFIVTSVGLRAFENCSALNTVVVSEGIRSIGNYAFKCENRRVIYLPATLMSVHENAFFNCGHVEHVYSAAEAPILLDSDPFYDVAKNNPVLHVPIGCATVYASTVGWDRFSKIVDDIAGESKGSMTLNASLGGSLAFNESEVHGCMDSVDVDAGVESVVVSAIPDHGYEFKSLTVTGKDGKLIHYSFEHQGGDIIAAIPFEDGMVVAAVFEEPAVYSLQVKLGDGGRYDVSVNADKAYSFRYAAPTGWAVSSVSFNNEPLDIDGIGGNAVMVTTPKLQEDSQLNIVIHDIQTGVSRAAACAPMVRNNSDGIVIEGLPSGARVQLTDTSGRSTVYEAIGGRVEVDSLPEGIYIIAASGYLFKIRH